MILAEGGPPSRELSGQEVQANPAGRQTEQQARPEALQQGLGPPEGLRERGSRSGSSHTELEVLQMLGQSSGCGLPEGGHLDHWGRGTVQI